MHNSPILYNDPTGHDSIISEFLAGVASEVVSSIGWFIPPLQADLAPSENESVAKLAGRIVGDFVSMTIGVALVGTGGGGMAGGTLCAGLTGGGCLPVGAPTVVAGAALALEGAGTGIRGAIGLAENTYLLAKKTGIFKRPSSFRKSTLDSAWESAENGRNGGKLCPECGQEVNVKPGTGPRDWHADHILAWIKRNLSAITTRKGVLDEYNEGIRLLCPTCNLKKGPK